MLYAESQEPNAGQDYDDESSQAVTCAQGHRRNLAIATEEGGSICLPCFSNLISNPRTPTVQVSYALSQLSLALSQPSFLSSLLSFHPHFLVSPLIRSLASFDDDPIAQQVFDLIAALCASADASVVSEFVTRVSDSLSLGDLAWSRRQLYMLHCFGILLNCRTVDPLVHIRDTYELVSNLVSGLKLPSDEIQGEILFVLYKLSKPQEALFSDIVDVLRSFCPPLLCLSLEALMKSQKDDVRLNCIALLTICAQRGLFNGQDGNGIRSLGFNEADNFLPEREELSDEPSLDVLLADAIKGPLLSPDSQVQISALDLIFHYLSWEEDTEKKIQVLVEENVTDYVFEILRLSDLKDALVSSCIKVLNIFSIAEQPFRQKIAVGFATLIPVLQYVAEIPLHPVQRQTLKLVMISVSDCPGIVSSSNVEELLAILTKMLERYSDAETCMIPETLTMTCLILTALLKLPCFHAISNQSGLVQQALKNAILAGVTICDKNSSHLLNVMYLLKEAYGYSHEEIERKSDDIRLRSSIIDICTSHLLPWFTAEGNYLCEETVLGILEALHSILLHPSDPQATELGRVLLTSSWLSVLFGYLGLFPTERMKLRVYQMIGSLVNIVVGENHGQSVKDAALILPSDPSDLLLLLGQKSSSSQELSSAQSAVLVILHVSCLYDDRLAYEKSILASLEQYILVNCGDLVSRAIDEMQIVQLVNIYGKVRGLLTSSSQISYSLEAERFLFHLLNHHEWDLSSSMIHPVSIKWLFQQEQISPSLSHQLLNFSRRIYSDENQNCRIIVGGKGNVETREIADLIAASDNYAPSLLVCLLARLADEGSQEHDITAVLNLVATVMHIVPVVANQLCLHGIASAIQALYNMSTLSSSSSKLLMAISLNTFDILWLVHPEALSDEMAWLSLTMKLMDFIRHAVGMDGWSYKELVVIGIFCLILHHSSNVLLETSKSIVSNTYLISAINRIVEAACSKGPALYEHDERTSTGQNLIFSLLLHHFSLIFLRTLLPGAMDWRSLLDPSKKKQSICMINIHCQDLCRLLHFGSPVIKLLASNCLLESFKGISSDQENTKLLPECSSGYLMSIKATLQGLVFHNDLRVAMNCALCLSMIIEWEEELYLQDSRPAPRSSWCRLIVEEMAVSLAIPCLASKSFTNHHRPAAHVTAALLKAHKVPEWMGTVFHEACISGIIQNLTAANITAEMVILFRALTKSNFLKPEHLAGLNRILQGCRKRIYNSSSVALGDDQVDKYMVSPPEDLEAACERLIHLVSCQCPESNSSGQNDSKRLLEEIEMYFKDLKVQER